MPYVKSWIPDCYKFLCWFTKLFPRPLDSAGASGSEDFHNSVDEALILKVGNIFLNNIYDNHFANEV